MGRALAIGEVADRSGFPTSTLRYYDEIGLVPAAGRVGGQRRYDEAVLRRLRLVGLFQRTGFSLAEISLLLDAGGDWRGIASRQADTLGARIAELAEAKGAIEAALACGCEDLEQCDAPATLTTPHRTGDCA